MSIVFQPFPESFNETLDYADAMCEADYANYPSCLELRAAIWDDPAFQECFPVIDSFIAGEFAGAAPRARDKMILKHAFTGKITYLSWYEPGKLTNLFNDTLRPYRALRFHLAIRYLKHVGPFFAAPPVWLALDKPLQRWVMQIDQIDWQLPELLFLGFITLTDLTRSVPSLLRRRINNALLHTSPAQFVNAKPFVGEAYYDMMLGNVSKGATVRQLMKYTHPKPKTAAQEARLRYYASIQPGVLYETIAKRGGERFYSF